jgi:hypothetical protein
MTDIPASAERFGLSAKSTGGHMARSMMRDELTALLSAAPLDASTSQYKAAILEDNVLGKPTFASREKSYRHLVELYSLDPGRALFRVLRQLANEEPASLPLLAMTCSFCRDAQLRHSFDLIDSLKTGEALPRERMEQHLEAGFPGRFSPAMKKSLAQNVNTTWTVSGHVAGKVHKTKTFPAPRPAASTYAMFAGFLLGLRGQLLLQSVFGRLVVSDPMLLIRHLSAGSARGWLRFRHAGGVFETDFSPLLTAEEREVVDGAH